MNESLDIIFKEDVQNILDHFAACFDIRIVYFTPDGKEARVGLNRPDSAYCRYLQKLYGHGACLDLDKTKRREATAQSRMICYECYGGLVEAIKPVIYEGRLMGYVAIGQFRVSRTMPERIIADSARTPYAADMATAFNELPVVPKARIDHILGLFSILVDYIVAQHMVSQRTTSAYERMRDYLQAHINEDISVMDLAGLIRRSRSTVHHLFVTYAGRSFKQTLIEIRLKRAAEMLRAHPAMTVKDVALAVGYQDALYFSRLFKKHYGVAPSHLPEVARRAAGP